MVMGMREKMTELVNNILSYLPWGEISPQTAQEVADHLLDNDVVPVVRCKDCKYAMDMMPIENSGGYMMGECTLRKEDDIVFTAWGDDFCSYGERKEK